MTNLFFYKILFMTEILTAEWLFTFRLHKRAYYLWRFLGGAALLLGISAAIPVPVDNIWFSSLVLMAEFGLSLPWLYFCYDEPLRNIIFCGVAAYTLQHCAYGVVNLCLSLIFFTRSPLLSMYENAENSLSNLFAEFSLETLFCILIYMLCYLGTYALAGLAFANRIRKGENMRIKNYMLLVLCACGLLADIILNSALMMTEDLPFINAVGEHIYNILCCVLFLYLQYSMVYEKELKNELAIVKSLLMQKQQQYEMSKENIDLINLKCHDMKHQIRQIGQNESISSDVLKEIENSIGLYDSVVKTGNDVLDVILTEKSLLCRKNGILLSIVADGARLNFIKETDLYSLFGNAMDNAIEGVMKLSDPDRRIIGLKIHETGGFVAVNLQNPCAGDIRFDENHLPMTDKGNTEYHGFGMKSISYVVENYRGSLSVGVKNGSFYLNIIFPNEREAA